MKAMVLMFCFAALAVGAARAAAAPNELERLLNGETVGPSAARSTRPVADVETVVAESGPDSASFPHRAAWSTASEPSEVDSALHRSTSAHADDPAAPAEPVSAVPEPSAIILALAALVYFLLFGRRRRV
jgi:hypothetical protein